MTITNSLKEKLGKLAGTIDKKDQSLYRVECALHETQQYLRERLFRNQWRTDLIVCKP